MLPATSRGANYAEGPGGRLDRGGYADPRKRSAHGNGVFAAILAAHSQVQGVAPKRHVRECHLPC